jgi:hypothetical protein
MFFFLSSVKIVYINSSGLIAISFHFILRTIFERRV